MPKKIYTHPLFWATLSVIFVIVKFSTLQSRVLDSITIAGQIFLVGFNLCMYLEGTNYDFDERDTTGKKLFSILVFFQSLVFISLIISVGLK